MKENYKCSCCGCWYEKNEIDHVSHSTEEGNPKQYIQCENCKKAGCFVDCKYINLNFAPERNGESK